MKITWTENPLETRVELDEADKKLLFARLKAEYLEDMIFSAHFELKSEKAVDERVANTSRVLDVNYICDDSERNGKTLTQWLDELVADYTQELLSKHIGDCTCVPCSCTKCRAESMLEIDTIRGLGKHSSYKIDSAFSGGASIDEAIRRLENYQPTYDPNSKWPRSDWEQHVPRWIEEGKRAHAWLVAYRDEHFVKVDHEQR